MDKYKSFYGILLIIIILLNFVSVCATNSGPKKSKGTDGSVDSGSSTKTTKSGDEATPKPTDTKSAKPSEGGAPPASSPEGGSPPSSPAATSVSPPEGGTSPPEGGAPGAPSTSPPKGGASPPEGGAPSTSPPKGGASPPEGGTPSTSPPVGTTPGGENNATILAYVLFSSSPSTTTVGRPEVKGLISLYQPPNGNTVVTGHIGAILNRINGNYKFTIKGGDGTILYDCTGRVNPLFIGQASLFSFTWNEIKLSGPKSAIGNHFDIEESGGTLVNALIVEEFKN
ncbi:unnamed protein product [Rhizophagus irregularis]|uniref:Uncharacterized protein n=1 Tax=Rhizophagus irregularis TaxID=588596 RepID=A0A2N1N6T4_9GLOM|nr:hypothetical protein RhiirC2_780744 [Rhizophagus irregularis]CAB4393654.1 unnamed protein product [Rhizophagus irregularis]CAB5387728.1 unnamed protein product [Rhizophagus irregularis]